MASSSPSDDPNPEASEVSKRRKKENQDDTQAEEERKQDEKKLRKALRKCMDIMEDEVGPDIFDRVQKREGKRAEQLNQLVRQAWEGTAGAWEILKYWEAKKENPPYFLR